MHGTPAAPTSSRSLSPPPPSSPLSYNSICTLFLSSSFACSLRFSLSLFLALFRQAAFSHFLSAHTNERRSLYYSSLFGFGMEKERERKRGEKERKKLEIEAALIFPFPQGVTSRRFRSRLMNKKRNREASRLDLFIRLHDYESLSFSIFQISIRVFIV